jgi:hypothetical protein
MDVSNTDKFSLTIVRRRGGKLRIAPFYGPWEGGDTLSNCHISRPLL